MRKLAIAVALSSTLLATPAFARDGAWYVGGEFGAMIVEDIDIDTDNRNDAITLSHDYGYDGGLFAGYDLGGFRLEAEVAYKKADLDSFVTQVLLPGEGNAFPTGRPFAGGNTSALSFMINGMLDFGDDDGISGFVGGGIGMARVKFNNQRVFANTAPFIDDSDSKLAWQVFAGVRQAITDNIDVTVKYRFFNVDNLELVALTGGPGVPLTARDADARFRSHSLLGGITFNFGGPDRCRADQIRNSEGVCEDTKRCTPDGPLVPVSFVCPPPPVETKLCPPNGPRIPVTAECPRIEQPVHVCPPHNLVIPADLPCPPALIVFFEWDVDHLTEDTEQQKLDQVAEAYRRTGQVRLILAGHADKSGPNDYNMDLSRRRAENIRKDLVARGIPNEVIGTEYFGEERPKVETADGVKEQQNRRVEIVFGPGSGS